MTETIEKLNFQETGDLILHDLELLYNQRIAIIVDQIKEIRRSLPEDLSKADNLRGEIVGLRMDISILSIEMGSEYKNIISILSMAEAHEKREKARLKQEIGSNGSSLGKVTLSDAATAQYDEQIDQDSLNILRARGTFFGACMDEIARLDSSMREVSISIGSASKSAREAHVG